MWIGNKGEIGHLESKKGKADGGPRAHDFDTAFELDNERIDSVEPEIDGVGILTSEFVHFAYNTHQRRLCVQLRQVLHT